MGFSSFLHSLMAMTHHRIKRTAEGLSNFAERDSLRARLSVGRSVMTKSDDRRTRERRTDAKYVPMTMTVLRCVLPRAAAKVAFRRGTLHRITKLCVIVAAPVLADSSRSIFRASTRSCSSAPSTEALNVLQNFISRLEEPVPHRKPSSRADEAARRSTLQGLATSLSTEYTKLPPLNAQNEERAAVLTLLAKECGSSEDEVASAVEQYQQYATEDSAHRGHLLASLRQACTPRYDRLFHLLLEDDARRGMQFLVSMRRDLLLLMDSVRTSSDEDELLVYLKELDSHMKNLLSAWFGPGMLMVERITYEGTSALIIEKIATSEAVHPVRSLEDLRTRLGDDHRVFCAFHQLLPDEPLVFCHVALRPNVSSTMTEVLETQHDPDVRTAVFYSISSTQVGLSGVDLGQLLLKEAMSLLQLEFSTLETFVTLSPIPRFHEWLQDKITMNQGGTFVDYTLLTEQDTSLLKQCFGCPEADVLDTFSQHLEDPSRMMKRYAEDLEPLLMKLAARYLLHEKHHGKPLDGVARFHVPNGAEMFQLNYRADESRKGWHNSLGIMINYRYNMSTIAKNQLQYELNFNIPVCEGVSKWLPPTVNE